jgi:hypothetical protein
MPSIFHTNFKPVNRSISQVLIEPGDLITINGAHLDLAQIIIFDAYTEETLVNGACWVDENEEEFCGEFSIDEVDFVSVTPTSISFYIPETFPSQLPASTYWDGYATRIDGYGFFGRVQYVLSTTALDVNPPVDHGLVPDIVNLSREEAVLALGSNFTLGSTSGTTSVNATPQNEGKIATQSLVGDQSYGSVISYTTFAYSLSAALAAQQAAAALAAQQAAAALAAQQAAAALAAQQAAAALAAQQAAATLSSLTFTDDGTGTGGTLNWSGVNINAVLYTGPITSYPGQYNYGTFTSTWNGQIINLTPDTSYTVSIYAITANGNGELKSLTFKTSSVEKLDENDLDYWKNWLNTRTLTPGEAVSITKQLTKFNALKTSTRLSYVRVPTSRVLTITAKSLTPKACSLISPTAKVKAGLVTAHTQDTCTISYTVTGRSKKSVTLTKNFLFKKVAK